MRLSKIFLLIILIVISIPAKQTITKDKRFIQLNETEIKFINHHTPIKYVYDVDWKPFEWTNDLDEHTGIIASIMHLIEEKSGLNFIAINTESWSEAIDKVKTNQASMFSVIGVTKERKEYLQFTQKPLFSTPYVLVSRKNEDYSNGFDNLKNAKVATIGSSTIESLLKEKRPNVNFSLVKTAKDGFDNLEKNKIDVLVINAASAKYYINIIGYKDLKIAYKTKLVLDLRIAVRKDTPKEVITIINKSLDVISKKEIDDIFYKWTEIRVKKEINWILIWQIIFGALLIFIFLIFNNKKLKNMVKKQTYKINQQNKKLENLVASFDKYVIAFKTDENKIITYVSEALSKITGYDKTELIGKPYDILIDKNSPNLNQTLMLKEEWHGELKNNKKDGDFYWSDTVVSIEYDKDGTVSSFNFISQDITDKKIIEELSITDGLTNIYNRRYFNDIFHKIIDSSKRADSILAFFILDIDNFKLYNDTYGHQMGDKTLIKVALTIKESLHRGDDYCFRLGGEEFGVLFKIKSKNEAEIYANKIRKNIENLKIEHKKNNNLKYVTVSIGLVCKKAKDIKNETIIFKEADDLLYLAKHNGRNKVCINEN